MFGSYDHPQAEIYTYNIYFRLKMVTKPKHVAVTEWNIQTSVALDGNPESDCRRMVSFTFRRCYRLVTVGEAARWVPEPVWMKNFIVSIQLVGMCPIAGYSRVETNFQFCTSSRPWLPARSSVLLEDPPVAQKQTKTKLHGLSPRATYTDRAAAACRRS
jgi:hypothetical protein